jgi:hypothetical protein
MTNEQIIKMIHELLQNEELIEELKQNTDILEFQKNRSLLRSLNHFQNRINLRNKINKKVITR